MTHTIEKYHQCRGKLLDRLGGKCVDCGSLDNLEFHTIDGNGENEKGGWKKLAQVISDIENNNIELKCRECHINYHQENGTGYNGKNNNGKTTRPMRRKVK